MAQGTYSDRSVTETWSAICDLFRTDVPFTTAEATRKLMQSEGWTYNQARNRAHLALTQILGTTPDLERQGKYWILPSIEERARGNG